MPITAADLTGVTAATVLPFRSDYTIDEPGLESVIQSLLGHSRMKGILVNGLAGEVTSLTREERRAVTEVARDVIGSRCKLISGVASQSTREAIETAMDAEEAGADAILIAAPGPFARGGSGNSEAVLRFFRAVSESVGVPVLVFQHSAASGLAYPIPVLTKLCQMPRVLGVKSTVWEQERYERELVALRALEPVPLILSGNDNILLSTFAAGCDGALLGVACLLPDFIIDLFTLVQNNQLRQAQEIYNQFLPLLHALYAPPGFSYYPRMKEAMVMLGMLREATVRPPLVAVNDEERALIRRGLKQAGLL